MTEYVFYGGKGGVGKTSCAAATGLELAGRGARTLVVSTDPAHSLGDSLETELSGEPTRVAANLWAVEADPEAGQETYRGIVSVLAAEFREAGVRLDDEDVERLFAAGFVPGSDEIAALEFIGEYAEADAWDYVVFDTAPTGHTLRLLTLPDVLRESLSTVGKVRGQLRRLVASARSVVFGPAALLRPGREPDEVDALRERMERVAALLRDPERTDFRVVLLPETLAIEETRRLVERLREFDVPVDTLLVNRVLEDVDENCDRCAARKARHERRLERVRETFPDCSVRVVPELDGEAYGRDALSRLAERIDA
ncbi:ArsA family ATPase [Halomarina halobia]|uniref:ArsA family ATPase n=1 Tax=Halomarina halobia TaxID=3033386 RepID=A0ABD6AF55_9EURY|nr:TRC40/GET3/ArsA family transport-energizing ATPase [Halomarina sp. PSR21]